jgi:polar amino acid transport system substrate-binding protein
MEAAEPFQKGHGGGLGTRRRHRPGHRIVSSAEDRRDSGGNRRRRAGRVVATLASLLTVNAALLAGAAGVARAFTDMQVRGGATVYKHQCARCHGPNLEGKDDSFRGLRAPRLTGAGALPCKPRPYQKLRQHDFKTLKDVYDFVSATMPADQPASLSSAEYWNVLAFVLSKNGKTPDNNRLDAESSKKLVLHATCAAAPAGSKKAQP